MKETLKGIFKVCFLGSKLTDDALGQKNLDLYRCRINQRDCNLIRNLINQSKIPWALSTFKLFKAVGTEEILQVI
jgi:hypothetical protein